MAKSSINFAKASSGGLRHNDRSDVPDYLLPEEFRLDNSFDLSANEAEKKMMSLYAEAKKNYLESTGQKLQATSYRWEAVINLNKEHTLEDVQRLSKELEKETGFTSVQIAIHRDEGRVQKDKQGSDFPIHNYHAHVTFFTLDRETGVNLYRKDITPGQRKEIEKEIFEKQPGIKKGEAGSEDRKEFNKLLRELRKEKDFKVMDTQRLSKIQTMTAKSLGMVRGKVSVKEEARKLGVDQDLNPAERLGHKQYKKTKQEQERSILAKQKDLKAEIAELREELKTQGAGREKYAELEEINKNLKKDIKSKDLTISKLHKEIQNFKNISTPKEVHHKKINAVVMKEKENIEGAEDISNPKEYVKNEIKTNEISTLLNEHTTTKNRMIGSDEIIIDNPHTFINHIQDFLEDKVRKIVKQLKEYENKIKEQASKILGLEKENKYLMKEVKQAYEKVKEVTERDGKNTNNIKTKMDTNKDTVNKYELQRELRQLKEAKTKREKDDDYIQRR